MSPALALSVLSETVAQYLLAQSKALPIMASSLVGLTLSPLLYWGAVFWWVHVPLCIIAAQLQGTCSYKCIPECTPECTHMEFEHRLFAGWASCRFYLGPCMHARMPHTHTQQAD